MRVLYISLESTLSGKVNPCVKGLVRLDGSVAQSHQRVKDHPATFNGSGPFLFPHSLPGCQCGQAARLHHKSLKPQGVIDPTLPYCLKFTLNIPEAYK